MKKFYLYKITNQVNGKLYIGITSNPENRKKAHFSEKPKTNFTIVQLAMNKHGRENFTFEIICIGEKDYILDLEVKAIALYRTREKEFGYNIKPGGETGRGYAVRFSKRDEPKYVNGFWFPTRRCAVKALGITVAVFKNRVKRGTLGDVAQPYKKLEPRYVGDFWFPSLQIASESLNIPYQTLSGRIITGFVGSKRSYRDQSGEKGSMFGVDPKDHPSSVPLRVFGIEYNSKKEASIGSGHSLYIINKRLKENHPDFSYK